MRKLSELNSITLHTAHWSYLRDVQGGSSKPDSGEKGKKKRKKVAKAAKSEYTTIESSKTLHIDGDLEEEGGTDEIVSIMGGAAIAAAANDVIDSSQ